MSNVVRLDDYRRARQRRQMEPAAMTVYSALMMYAIACELATLWWLGVGE